jgi:lipoprotein-anchoring transpeptidase ErfK/SrfK
MKQRTLSLVVVCTVVISAPASWARWNEEDFYHKRPPVYVVAASPDPTQATTVIGSQRLYTAHKGDTFFDLARFYGLGYNELIEANPDVDPWLPWYPSETQQVVLPTEWVLPQVPYQGIVVNIPEMRLYHFHPRKGNEPQRVSTFAVGLGRDDWRTPQGKFRVRGKTKNPTWNIPVSIQKERIAEKGYTEKSIPGGSPDNPLGKYRIELTLPMYTIHGTNIPWGVGMQVSHGCIRLYPEDIEQLFPMVPVGTPGEFVYQPVKIGARGGRIYAEVHKDIYNLVPALYRQARIYLDRLGWRDRINEDRLLDAIQGESGVPVDITAGADELRPFREDFRQTRALPRGD